jgi:arginase
MKLTLVAIPYDSGHRDYRTGAGPRYLVDGGVRETLESLGHDADVVTLEATKSPTTEIATAFDLYRQLGSEVRAAVTAGRQPVVFAGNCNCVVGTLGGLRRDDVALVFFDGHGDFNTPETTTTGFLDGMGLAMATGRCWKEMAGTIEGFEPLRDSRVFLVGARDVDPLEREGLASSGVSWLTVEDVRGGGLHRALVPLSEQAPKPALYLHFDMDVLDPDEARANRLAPPGGLTVDELLGAAAALRAGFEVAAVSIASVEPEGDEGGRTLAATTRLIATLFPS